MNNKLRSYVSKNSNSLNAMIKKTSMTFTNNNFKKIAFIATAIVMLSVIGTFGFSDNIVAFAKKPQTVIDWSNGFPSGEHSTMNIHGKKADYNCDNSLEGTELYGNSVFVQMYGTSEINIVSNKRSSITEGKAIDPCAAPFEVTGNDDDPALYQLPTGEHQVYWRILGKPNNGVGNDGSSEARITSPTLIDQCNFLPVAYEDGTKVQSFDPDAGLVLIAFNADEKYVDANSSSDFDAGDSIYRDDGSTLGKVDTTDTLLYGPPVLDDGTIDLVAFTAAEQHEDDTGSIPNEFDGSETVYLSADAVVSEGDTRLANASSQGLPEDQGGDAVNCEDQTLVGLGLVNNKGAFEKTEEGLKRFGDETGKGKSKAVEITDLFLWTGSVCDATILDVWDTDSDGSLTINDFETGVTDDEITAAELAFHLGITEGEATIIIDAAEDAVIAEPNDDVVDNGVIDTVAEFAAFLEIQFGETYNCVAFYDEWVFNVADIVLYGFDYENNGTTLSQIRFYPTATTEFVE